MRNAKGKGCWYNPLVRTVFCGTCEHPVVVPFIVKKDRARIGTDRFRARIQTKCMRCCVTLKGEFEALGCIGCEQLCCKSCIRIVCDQAIEKMREQRC